MRRNSASIPRPAGRRKLTAYDEDDDRRVRLPADESGEVDFDTELERPKISFADVGGMESLKEEIRLKILHPLANPELYKMYGKSVGGGILMYGPPGCGKTYLARATAGEAKAAFLAVGIEDVLDMWLGNSERRLHQLFETARQNTPCMLFFDEVDALGAKRSDMRASAARMLVNQFLSELDGVSHSNEGVLILAATNAPWHVDSAFRRPGRFDRVLFVPPPDAAARQDILRLASQGPAAGRDRLPGSWREDRPVLRRRPQGGRRSCRRGQTGRGDENRPARAGAHARSARRNQNGIARRPRSGSAPPETTRSIPIKTALTTTSSSG